MSTNRDPLAKPASIAPELLFGVHLGHTALGLERWGNIRDIQKLNRSAFEQVSFGSFTPFDLLDALVDNLPMGFASLPESAFISAGANRIDYGTSYIDLKGNYCAYLRRWIERKQDGSLHAHHLCLDVQPEFQGLGLSKALYASSDRLYERLGVGRISLIANGTVGRYAWALQGFDFAREHEVERRQQLLRNALQCLGITGYDDLVASLKHSWQFAGFRTMDPSGNIFQLNREQWYQATGHTLGGELKEPLTIGKAFMLSMADWDAQKDLSPGSLGRQVSEAYRRHMRKS